METTINLFGLSDQDLTDLHGSIVAEMTSRDAKRRETVIAEIRSLATEAGLDLASLSEQINKKPVRQHVVEPKYRNPINAAQAWSGRGRRPRWIDAEIKKGKTLEDFRI